MQLVLNLAQLAVSRVTQGAAAAAEPLNLTNLHFAGALLRRRNATRIGTTGERLSGNGKRSQRCFYRFHFFVVFVFIVFVYRFL